ncbi:hypothetical protein B0H17DRAFT_1143559, partial [Mycena rosella]
MPKVHKHPSNAQRGSNGMFMSNHPLPPTPELASEDGDSDNEIVWESATESESDYDSYAEEWQKFPKPMTYNERQEKRAVQKKKAEDKRRIAEMRSAEQKLAGAMDNQEGAPIFGALIISIVQTILPGKKRGPYGIGGPSQRTLQEKRKRLKSEFTSGRLRISETEFQRQMEALKPQSTKPVKPQPTLADMFKKRPRAASIPPEFAAGSSESGSKRPRIHDIAPSILLREEEEESSDSSEASSGAKSDIPEEVESSPKMLESEARLDGGNAAVDAIVTADTIAEWVDTILDDAAPLEPAEL